MSSPDAPDYEPLETISSLTTFDTLPLQVWPEQRTADGTSSQLYLAADHGITVTPAAPSYRIGEPHLPVAQYREHFLDTVAKNQMVIVTAETGTGKSSNLGLYLLEAGASKVYVTQPRILAARELMERARHNLGPDYAHLAGYLTGNSEDSDCPASARLIYVTEDLLFRMVNRGSLPDDAVVINDEAHEKGVGTIILLGKMKKILPEHPGMRLVISSATIDEEKFSAYLDNAPVLRIPGRTHPIERSETQEDVATAMRRHMRRPNGRNVLGFEPGVGRLKATWAKAQSRMQDHEVHKLYGDQSPREQSAALNASDHHHIVASRIGETSITPENKDVVIDSGLSNLGGYEAGKRTLTTDFSSHAVMRQRMGRVGRTKPGIYELATPRDIPVPPAFNERPAYDPPVIENSSVASYIAELSAVGERLEDLDLLERPTEENLRHDYKLLHKLGFLALQADGTFHLTDLGKLRNNLPLDEAEARMLIEARHYTAHEAGEYPDAVRLQVAAAVAVQQVKSILDFGPGAHRRYQRSNGYQAPLSVEQTSDLLFELDIFIAMREKHRALIASGVTNIEEQFETVLHRFDILPNRYYKALRTFEELCRRETIEPAELQKPNREQRQNIIACQIAGATELFVQRGKQTYRDIRGESRTIGRRSAISPTLGNLVIGTAFDFRGLSKAGRFEKRLISGGSVVTVAQLLQHMPDRISRQVIGTGVNKKGQLVERQALFFDTELRFSDIETQLPATRETRELLITAMMTGSAPDLYRSQQRISFEPGTQRAADAVRVWQDAQQFEHKSHVRLDIGRRYARLIAKTIEKSLDLLPLEVTDPAEIDALIPKVYVNALVRPSRKRRTLPGIIMQSPDGIPVHVDSDNRQYVDVRYKNNVAYVTIPRDGKFTIQREDFAGLETYHGIRIRIANGKYQWIDGLFKQLDSEREANALRQQRRAERRAEQAVQAARGQEKAERQRRIGDEHQLSAKAERLAKVIPLRARGSKRGEARRARMALARDNLSNTD